MRANQALVAGLAIGALLLGSGLLGGCASGGGESAAESSGGDSAKQAPAKGVAPPAGHKMAKVELNMDPQQVRQIMGEPNNINGYITGKAFIPWYFGSDSGRRTDYKYKGQGRVVFGINRWSGQEKVIRIDYDPAEDGN